MNDEGSKNGALHFCVKPDKRSKSFEVSFFVGALDVVCFFFLDSSNGEALAEFRFSLNL